MEPPHAGGDLRGQSRKVAPTVSTMQFSREPTARGDEIAAYAREWYEANRETWWQRHKPGIIGPGPDRSGRHADEFMLRFVGEVRRIIEAAE